MNFIECFENLKEILCETDVSDYNGKLAYQFNIKGEGAGTFYVEINGGKLSIEPYEYYDRDSEFTAAYNVFLSIINGKSDPVKLVLSGKLKVDGSIDKALEIKNFI